MVERFRSAGDPDLRFGMATDRGGRRYNEDACVVHEYSHRRTPRYLCFMAIADGMGGHKAGDVASETSIQMLEQIAGPGSFSDHSDFEEKVEQTIWNAFSAINSHIYNLGLSPECKGMGTTLTCALIDGSNAYIGHVGDTRAYRISAEGASQVTEDHSVVGKLLHEGVITEREAMTHDDRNILTRAIGPELNVEIDILKVPLLQGEILLLCSDGLYSVVSSDEITRALATEADLQKACAYLVALARERGSDDNISVVMWRMPSGEELAGGSAKRLGVEGSKRRKLRWRTVAILATLALLAGFGVGWLMGLSLEEGSNGSAREQVTGAAVGFGYGATVEVTLSDRGDTYRLRARPDRDAEVVALLPDACRLRVLTKVESTTDESGEAWYQVRVIDDVQARGSEGYIISSYLRPQKEN